MNLVSLIPAPRLAHAFGTVYNLPVPLWLYLYGGATAIVLSFLAVALLVGEDKGQPYSRQLIASSGITKALLRLGQMIALVLTAITVITGLLGKQQALSNFNVTFFWVIFYLGVTYLIAVFGNFWPSINPVRLVIRGAENLSGAKLKPLAAYPGWLGYLPALAFYVALICLELLSAGWGIIPANLSKILIAYGLLQLAGVVVFGLDWLSKGDFFTVFFGLVGRLSPLEYRDGIRLRPPLSGLLSEVPAHFALVLFVIFMLSSTAFDGLRETRTFGAFYNWLLGGLPFLVKQPGLTQLTLLLLMLGLFTSVYLLCIWLMRAIIGSRQSAWQLAKDFAFTLVPIAVTYNAAHYFTLLLIQGQLIFHLLSDPLGRGWNLLGTAGWGINARFLSASGVWYAEVGLIVAGHMAAVYLAHRQALKIFEPKKAVLSQYPMLLLMVIYTMTSLWILAQPFYGG